MSDYVPLSVRTGGRRKKLGWWWQGRMEALALRLAPWLAGSVHAHHQEEAWKCFVRHCPGCPACLKDPR